MNVEQDTFHDEQSTRAPGQAGQGQEETVIPEVIAPARPGSVAPPQEGTLYQTPYEPDDPPLEFDDTLVLEDQQDRGEQLPGPEQEQLFLTYEQAARELSVSQGRIREMVSRGQLRTEVRPVVVYKRVIPRDEIENYKHDPNRTQGPVRRRGRPRNLEKQRGTGDSELL